MLLKSLGLSVSIVDVAGIPLPEYQQKEIADGVIECWIPSTDGANFRIKWEVIDKETAPMGCDSRATPYFDGVRFGSGVGYGHSKGELGGHRVGHTTVRLYEFGKRRFTDEDNLGVMDVAPVEDLGTIRVDVSWGYCFHMAGGVGYFDDPSRGPVHEKLAKKGFGDSAALGRAIDAPPPSARSFIQQPGLPTGRFMFRYASEGWLQSEGIIPCIPKSETSAKSEALVKLDFPVKSEPSGSCLGRKRARSTPPEVIDVDAFEDDDDEITIISIKKPKLEDNVKN